MLLLVIIGIGVLFGLDQLSNHKGWAWLQIVMATLFGAYTVVAILAGNILWTLVGGGVTALCIVDYRRLMRGQNSMGYIRWKKSASQVQAPQPAPPGWYADPYSGEANGKRWWDGFRWTNVADNSTKTEYTDQ